MTWLHLTVPVLLVATIWSSNRASEWFGGEGMVLKSSGGERSRLSFRMFLYGWLWQAGALFLAAAAGFVAGRL